MEEPEVVATGDEGDDFVELYRSQYARLVRALELAGAGRATAEDLAQEAFARTFRAWSRVRSGTNPPGYLYRVAFRLLTRDRRVKRGTDRSATPGAAIRDAGTPGMEDAVAVQAAVRDALGALPVQQRACVVLCLCVGMTSDEAGKAVGMSAAAVRKQLERARPLLRVALR